MQFPYMHIISIEIYDESDCVWFAPFFFLSLSYGNEMSTENQRVFSDGHTNNKVCSLALCYLSTAAASPREWLRIEFSQFAIQIGN